CEKLRVMPHKHICKYHGVQTSRALRFQHRSTPIEVPMEGERVLNLVFDKYDCDLWEAIWRGYAVHVRECLEAVASAIRHYLGIVHGDIEPKSIFLSYSKAQYNATSTRYAVGDFDSGQPTGSVVDGKHGTPYWSQKKKVWIDTVEEDDDWCFFFFEKLTRWLIKITKGRLEEYEEIGRKVEK
ncbi:hypothetical protein BKA58DRAFT_318370, partial [Alternaria rosae]|uniref:uncharacterized protein n=1 Tax=Alternaria rosae TaxID=1187941 RepID=UPI001E8E9007